MATLASLRADTTDYIRYRLGDGMVDVELDPEHYDNSIDKAVKRFRQRSQNAYESSYVFLSVVKNNKNIHCQTRLKKFVRCIDAVLVVAVVTLVHSLNRLKQHFKTLTCYKVDALAVWQHMKCTISIRN